jgi:hypothetical protein
MITFWTTQDSLCRPATRVATGTTGLRDRRKQKMA